MVIDAHQDFMRAGAKVITTNNFTVRKLRFSENDISDKFDEALNTAGLLAKQAKQGIGTKQEQKYKELKLSKTKQKKQQTRNGTKTM